MKAGTVDIETNGLMPEVDVVWCASVLDHDTGDVRSFTPDTIDQLCAYLDTFDVLIGHNCIAYDFPVLRKVFGWEYKGKKVDTLLMSRLQRPNRISPRGCKAGPHSVEAWGFRLGHAKVEHEDWEQFSPAMLHRNQEDVRIQRQIYDKLMEEGKGEGWGHAHRLNMKLFHYLQLQEEHGWKVDEELLDKGIHLLNTWIDRISRVLEKRLPLKVEVLEGKKDGEYNWVRKPFKQNGEKAKVVLDYCGRTGLDPDCVGGPFTRISLRRIDLDKNAEVKDYLLALGWEPAEWNTNAAGKKTSPKLSKDDPFEGIQGSLGKLVAKRIQCRQRLGVLHGWREAVVDGRIHAGVAGMASTARLRHKLIVNVPGVEKGTFFAKWMRRIFTASPGMVMVGVDSSGNQIRQLAARMQDDEFTHAVLYGNKDDGTDLHSVNQRKAGTPTRGHAKNFFYGFIFGAGDWKIGKIIGGDAADGAALREQYLDSLPGLRSTIDSLVAQWRNTAQRYFDPKRGCMVYRNGYIKGIDGRPVLVESEHALLCYQLQSDEAIQMAVAYVMVHKWAEQRGWVLGQDWAMLCWMHDEFQMECKPELAKELEELACKAITWAGEYLKINCPHAGEGAIGNNWYETH